jgi:uncharacterized protein DUF5522
MSERPPGDSANKRTITEETSTESRIVSTPLEAEDYYYENGLMVFTAAYHLKRGYCCNSGCRHCPFR